MRPEIIIMLTHNDVTVKDAAEVFESEIVECRGIVFRDEQPEEGIGVGGVGRESCGAVVEVEGNPEGDGIGRCVGPLQHLAAQRVGGIPLPRRSLRHLPRRRGTPRRHRAAKQPHKHYDAKQMSHFGVIVTIGTSISSIEIPPCWKVPV